MIKREKKIQTTSCKNALLKVLFGQIGSLCLEKKILKFLQSIFAISLLSSLGKGCGPIFEQSWILLHSRMICAKFGWPIGSGKEDFQISSMYFHYFPLFPYNLHLKKSVALYIIICLLQTRMLYVKFGWNWPSASGEAVKMWNVYDNDENI